MFFCFAFLSGDAFWKILEDAVIDELAAIELGPPIKEYGLMLGPLINVFSTLCTLFCWLYIIELFWCCFWAFNSFY